MNKFIFAIKIKSKVFNDLEHIIEINLFCDEKQTNPNLFEEIDLFCFEKFENL